MDSKGRLTSGAREFNLNLSLLLVPNMRPREFMDPFRAMKKLMEIFFVAVAFEVVFLM